MTALGLVAAALATGSSAQGSPAVSAPQDSFKLRSSAAMAALGDADTSPAPSSAALRRAKAADRPSSTRTAGRQLLGSVSAGTGSSARGAQAMPRLHSTTTAEAAAADCTSLELGVTPTNEWVGVHWKPVGTGSYAVWRMRDGGTWRLVRTTTGTEIRDTGVNPDSTYTYLVVADGIGECYTDEWVSMATPDGWGIPDVIYGGAGGDATRTGMLMWQDPYSTALPASQAGIDPAFSADGRKVVAAAHDDATGWSITTMLTVQGGTIVANKPVGAGHMGLNPEWSPDGTRVVYTRFVRADDGTLSAPELRLLNPTTGTDTLIAGSAGLLQADWRSSTTLVAAGFGDGEGLFTLPVAGGTKKAVAGTSNAGYPQVAPDGTIWFTTGDGTSYTVSTVSPAGVVGARTSSTTSWWERPRIAPDGTVFVLQVDLNDPNDDTDDTFSVVQTKPAAWSPVPTAIGIATSDGLPGIFGYDIRQPKTRGTSDVVGDASGDILARDSAGVLWAFPSTPDDFISPRVRVGSGWNIYSSFVAAGDLNSDNRGDIVAKDKSGNLWFYAGRGNAKFAARVLISSGWGSLSYLAPGDLDGYGADLLAIKPDGRMYLFAGAGTGTKFVARELGSGFQNFTVIGVGDFNYDNTTDLLSRDRTTGKLYLNAGLGGGRFSAKKVVGNSGWAQFTGFGTPEFDGFTGLYAREAGGAMRFYATTGDGKFLPGYASVPGNWKPYLFSS
jgi:hypothetical protein